MRQADAEPEALPAPDEVVPVPDAALLELESLPPDEAEPLLEAASDAPAGLAALPLFRKSVTYQPEPFNWKPAAVTCLE